MQLHTATPPQQRFAHSVTDACVLAGGLLAGVAVVAALFGHAWAALPAAGALTIVGLLVVRAARHPREAPAPAALLDPVTGVPGPEALLRQTGVELARARRHGTALTVLHLDLVGFSALSERIGRGAANELLRRIALGMAAALRGEDLVARRGHDAFVVLLPGLSGEDVARVIARLGAVVERVRVEGVRLDPLVIDVAGARYPDDADSVQELLCPARARLSRSRDAQPAFAAPVPELTLASPADPPWPVRRALLAELPAAALLAAAWFGLPLLLDAELVRLVVVGLLGAAAGLFAVVVARRTSGRERSGWLLLAVTAPLGAVPYAGTISLTLLSLAILLIAGDGWTGDRFRVLDALLFAVIVVGALAFALPDAPTWSAGPWPAHLSFVVRGIGAAAAGATVLLVVTSVSRRARPDVWMLAGGYLFLLVAAVAAIRRGGVWVAPSGWGMVSAMAAVNVLAVLWLRRARGGAVSRELTDAHADGTLVALIGTIALIALLVLSTLVDGDISVVVVAALVAIAVVRHVRALIMARENRRLAALALRSQAERGAQNHASLLALTAALEARDGYTCRHGEETTSLTSRVAVALGLPAEERGEIDTVALLHDVGKIGTPNEILHKDGPLTDEEWVVMREHPVVGERILRAVPGFEAVAKAVRHEHERWDGGGYPDGIGGEEIPLASRIVLVCDAFHAMTSDRPYRGAMPVADALAELERNAGTQFDPAVVRALVALLRDEGDVSLDAGYQAVA